MVRSFFLFRPYFYCCCHVNNYCQVLSLFFIVSTTSTTVGDCMTVIVLMIVTMIMTITFAMIKVMIVIMPEAPGFV